MAKKEKEINPLWGGRFESGTDDLAQSFSASIDIDKRLFEVCLLYTSPSPRD